jgi:hypothetical protein
MDRAWMGSRASLKCGKEKRVILRLVNKLIFAGVINIVIATVYILKYKDISKEERGVHSSNGKES